ncbi:MAG: group III truncated hemoglobin, partial [Rhodothermales bacterium]
MEDIRDRKDIMHLVDTFYKQVLVDDVIGFIFTDVAKLDLDAHMPTMYDFWETTLLGEMKYNRNAMLKHIELNQKEPLLPAYFDRWLLLWERTVSANFAGEKADLAIKKANHIAELMKFKM